MIKNINKIINLINNNNNNSNNEILKLTRQYYCYLNQYTNNNNNNTNINSHNIVFNNNNNNNNNNNYHNNSIYNNNNHHYHNNNNNNKNYTTINNNNNNNKYYTTINNYNNINEFSFKVEKEIKKGDSLLKDSKSLNQSIKYYEDALQLTKDRIERALIYHRIALVKFKIGLITESNDLLELSLKLITNGIGDSIRDEFKTSINSGSNGNDNGDQELIINYPNKESLFKIYILKSMIQEKEFDLKNDPESIQSQKILERSIELWKFVILLNPNEPDGYSGVSRCILKQSEPDLLACFNLSNKALMCSKSHPPSLLLASEMLIIQNKDALASITLSLFFKYYKEFYSSSLLYTLKPKELVDAHFRYGLTLLKDYKFQQAFDQFTQAINISKSNISHPNQMNITMINSIMEKERLQFENNYNYNNVKMFSEKDKQDHHQLIEQHGLVSNYNQSNVGIGIIPSDQFKFNYNDCSILDIISSHYFRGKCLYQLKRFNDAILDFNYVIENQPTQIKAFRERAECYKALNDFITYQKDIKVFNDYQDQIKKRREENFEDYLDDSKNKKSKEYLQSFNNKDEFQDDDDDYSEDYDDDDYDDDDNKNIQDNQDYYDDDEDGRYKKRR